VISRKALVQFWTSNPDARSPLSAWFAAIKKGTFKTLPELKLTFQSVDYVPVGRGLYVFNLGGNKFRFIAAIHFNTQRLFVRHVLTHGDYDKGDWKNEDSNDQADSQES
jgi:mRNA interferase HigB